MDDYLETTRELVTTIRGTDTSQMDLRELRDELAECLETEDIDEVSKAFFTATLDTLKGKLALN